MQRRTPRKYLKHQASAGVTPAEALMLRLENIELDALERRGAEEERRLGTRAMQWLGWRMDDASPVGGSPAAGGVKHEGAAAPTWAMPASSDGVGRQAPLEWAKVFGNAMASYGLRHNDRVRLDHDVTPADGDIVLAEVQGVGRVLRRLTIIGGVHILSGDPGVKPIVIEDHSLLTYFGVAVTQPNNA